MGKITRHILTELLSWFAVWLVVLTLVLVVLGLLTEAIRMNLGLMPTLRLVPYILPTSLDVPHITSVIVEDPDPIGPLGVKGIGEPAMVPTIPAIMNAIYDAVGVRITELPATPEKVLMALKARERVESERRAAAQAAE